MSPGTRRRPTNHEVLHVRAACQHCDYRRERDHPTKSQRDTLQTGAMRHGQQRGHRVLVTVLKLYGAAGAP